MPRSIRYFAIRLGPIGYAESYPALTLNGKEVSPSINSGPNNAFYVHRVVSMMFNFMEYHNIHAVGPELYADCVFGSTSKSSLKKDLSNHFAGIRLDQIREL